MSNKASLTNTEIETTQRMQMHFPRGLAAEVLGVVNSCPVENLTAAILEMVEKLASGAKAVATKILEFVTTVKVTAVKKFVAADHFKPGKTEDGVKYYFLFGGNFTKHFLPKTEENVKAVDLRVHKLLRYSKDPGILGEIGEGKEETCLAYLHQLLKLQGEGQKEGVLLVDGCANIFYIRDAEDELWAVYADWHGAGWRLVAYSVEDLYVWLAGYQVFSR